MRRFSSILISCALVLSHGTLAQATPTLSSTSNPAGAMSSQASRAFNDGAKNFYRTLPPEVRNNPAVVQGARGLGILAPPPAQAPRPAHRPAPRPAPAQAPRPAPAPVTRDCSNCVAITFDDGPGDSTARLLDILAANRVHASFFLLGPKVQARPDLVRRMQASGHTIGNHSMTHPELNKVSPGQLANEINGGAQAIAAVTGTRPHWLRPPYGATNDAVARQAAAAGEAQALWNIDTLDWKTRDTANTCRVAVSQAHPGAIILMHDIHPSTVAAAQCVIDGLRAKGLRPASLDEMITRPQPGRKYFSR